MALLDPAGKPPPGPGRSRTPGLIFVIAYPAIKKDAMTALKNLKAKVESGS